MEVTSSLSAPDLRGFISQRLSAAAADIFAAFERSIARYEDELQRSRRLLEVSWKPHVKLRRIESPKQHGIKGNQDRKSISVQESAALLHIKQEEDKDAGGGHVNVIMVEPLGLKEEPQRPEITVSLEDELCSAHGVLETFGCRQNDRETLVSATAPNLDRDSDADAKLQNHRTCPRSDTEKSPAAGNQSRSDSEGKGFNLGIVGKELKFESQLKTDGSMHVADKPFACKTCGKGFSQRRALLIHIRSHTGEKPHPCATCGKNFRQPGHLMVHKRTHTGEKPHSCALCGKRFGQHGSLWNHMKIHTGEKPYACEVCGKRFVKRCNLLYHRRTHTGEKPHVCGTCGKTFSDKSNLACHARTHRDQPQHSCATCGKSFGGRSKLARHVRTHTGEKPHSCQICSKSFSQQSYLLCHMRTHTGEKPHACVVCGRSFSDKGNMLRHLRIHTGEKPYSCQTCGKSFRQQSSLSCHIRTHTGEKPYFCKQCGKAFSQYGHLFVHTKKHACENSLVADGEEDLREVALVKKE
ncbi:unnamed protein product [Ophioblennius macclurei]